MNRELKCISLPKTISKCCQLVKLCHINRSGPVFGDTLYMPVIPQSVAFTETTLCYTVLKQILKQYFPII